MRGGYTRESLLLDLISNWAQTTLKITFKAILIMFELPKFFQFLEVGWY